MGWLLTLLDGWDRQVTLDQDPMVQRHDAGSTHVYVWLTPVQKAQFDKLYKAFPNDAVPTDQ